MSIFSAMARHIVCGQGPLAACLVAALLCTGSATAELRERVGTGGIRVNQFRQYVITNETNVLIDGLSIGPVTRERVGTGGVRVRGQVVDASATLGNGDLTDLLVENHVRGPITALNPLTVLGQRLTVNADTQLENFASLAALALGQTVEVSAVLDSNGSAVATRIKWLPNGAGKWKLRGLVSQLNLAASSATIGSQPVSFSGVNVLGCNPLAAGAEVDGRASPVNPFNAGQVLVLSDLACVANGQVGTPGALAAIDGIVSGVVSASEFRMGALSVSHGTNTLFRNGNAEDVDLGVRLEVEGTYVTATTISARKIRFVRPSIRIEAPAVSADVLPGTSIRLLDEVLLNNPQVRDEDGLYASGLAAPRQLEVRGYADSAGQLFATRARIRRNDPRPTEIRLQGPVHDIARPNFKILGITVRSGVNTNFRSRTGTVITADTFFAALATGVEVEAEDASYNSTTRELDPTTLQLADDLVIDTTQPATGLGTAGGSMQGTADQIQIDAFNIDSFE